MPTVFFKDKIIQENLVIKMNSLKDIYFFFTQLLLARLLFVHLFTLVFIHLTIIMIFTFHVQLALWAFSENRRDISQKVEGFIIHQQKLFLQAEIAAPTNLKKDGLEKIYYPNKRLSREITYKNNRAINGFKYSKSGEKSKLTRINYTELGISYAN